MARTTPRRLQEVDVKDGSENVEFQAAKDGAAFDGAGDPLVACVDSGFGFAHEEAEAFAGEEHWQCFLLCCFVEAGDEGSADVVVEVQDW